MKGQLLSSQAAAVDMERKLAATKLAAKQVRAAGLADLGSPRGTGLQPPYNAVSTAACMLDDSMGIRQGLLCAVVTPCCCLQAEVQSLQEQLGSASSRLDKLEVITDRWGAWTATCCMHAPCNLWCPGLMHRAGYSAANSTHRHHQHAASQHMW